MTLTQDELFAKGAATLIDHIDELRAQTIEQLDSLRDHYETGHGGRHPIPKKNTPLDCIYKIVAGAVLDMQILRNIDPIKFGRIEKLSWVVSALAFATIPPDTRWADFDKEMREGLDKFVDMQKAEIDNPNNRASIIHTGEMVFRAEAFTGKDIKDL